MKGFDGEGGEGIDLFCDFHGGDFCGDGRAHASCDDESCEYGSEFSSECECDNSGYGGFCGESGESGMAL